MSLTVGAPFGSVMYSFVGKTAPFLILAFLAVFQYFRLSVTLYITVTLLQCNYSCNYSVRSIVITQCSVIMSNNNYHYTCTVKSVLIMYFALLRLRVRPTLGLWLGTV